MKSVRLTRVWETIYCFINFSYCNNPYMFSNMC